MRSGWAGAGGGAYRPLPERLVRTEFHVSRVASRVVALTVGGAALVVLASVTVGLPFAAGAQAGTARGDCAARFPKVIRDGFPEPAMRFSSHGKLRTTLRMSTGPVHVAGGRYTTETYEGKRIQKFVAKGMGTVSDNQGVLWPKR